MQLFVGNPNKDLAYQWNLFEGARGWFNFVIGGTGAKFALPHNSHVLKWRSSFARGTTQLTVKCQTSQSTIVVLRR